MRPKTFATLVIALVFACLGAYGKAATFSAASVTVRDDDARIIRQTLERRGLHFVARIPITVNSEYSVLRFVSRDCRGGIDIVPLYRNAEGQNLLSDADELTRTAIAFNGEIHNEFPAFHYWTAEIQAVLKFTASPVLQSRALVLREIGDCALMPAAAQLTHP